jgi:hypothetical protein
MIFEVEEYRITKQGTEIPPTYRVTLEVKGANPAVTGDVISRATTGERWFVLESAENKVFVSSMGSLPLDMVGSWGIKEHYKLEKS